MATRAVPKPVGAVRAAVLAAALVVAILIFLSYLQFRQVQMDGALVREVQNPGMSLAAVRVLLDRGANPNGREIHLPETSRSRHSLRDVLDWMRRPERRD